jgi:alpha-L-rhamnosidase
VRVEDHGTDRFVTSAAPPVRRIEELRPVSVREVAPRRWVANAGQNINGWVRLKRLGPAGTRITLTYGEWLDKDGDVTQDHVAYLSTTDLERTGTFQVDEVTSAGIDGHIFEPRHSTKGFQYVRIDGYDGTLTAEDVTAIVVHTDLRRSAACACRHPSAASSTLSPSRGR